MTETHSMDVSKRADANRAQGKQPQTRGVCYRKVSYGGIDGTYYTASTTRQTGSDGVSFLKHCISVVLIFLVYYSLHSVINFLTLL